MTDQRTAPALELTSPKGAKGQANRKATRPWFTKKRFILPLPPIVMMVIIQFADGGGVAGTSSTANSNSQRADTSAPQDQEVAADIGTKVRDGKFEFVVTGIERPGKAYPGKLQTTLTARGEFVIVRVDVTNIGNEAQAFGCQCQYLLNDKGQVFEPSSAILKAKDALKFVQLIDPGNTVRGALVVFDVAPGTKIVNIELHDSPVSKGVLVKLP